MNIGLSEFMKEEKRRRESTHPSKLGRYPPFPSRGSVTAMRKLNIDWRAVIDDDKAEKFPGKSVPIFSLPGNMYHMRARKRKEKEKLEKTHSIVISLPTPPPLVHVTFVLEKTAPGISACCGSRMIYADGVRRPISPQSEVISSRALVWCSSGFSTIH